VRRTRTPAARRVGSARTTMRVRRGVAAAVVGAMSGTFLVAVPRTASADDGLAVLANLPQLPGDVDALTGVLEAGGSYAGQANYDKVPFVGADPTHGLDPFSDLNSALADRFTADAFNLQDSANWAALEGAIDTVRSQLAGTATLGDEKITCGATLCTGSDEVRQITSVRIPLAASGIKDKAGADFEVKFDALKFLLGDQPPKVHAKFEWTLGVDLVVDAQGARLEPGAEHEMTLKADFTLENAGFDVQLGPVLMKAEPVGAPGFKGTITVDFAGSNFTSPTFGFENAGVDAHWLLTARTDSPLLGITTNFDIDWDLPTNGNLQTPSNLTVGLNHITVDFSKLLGESLAKTLRDIREVIEPIDTVTQPFVAPLPGFDTLSEDFGLPEVSLLSIAERFGVVPPGVKSGIKAIHRLYQGLGFAAEGGLDLGSVSLVDQQVLQKESTPTVALTKILSACGKSCEDAVKAIKDAVGLADGGLEFKFPVLDNPAILAGVLLGRDVDLFTFDTGSALRFRQPVSIPLFDVFIFRIDIGGVIEASLHLKGGYDTKGIMDAFADGGGPEDLINGLYLQDPGEPVVKLFTDVGARGVINLVAAEGRLEGGPVLDVQLYIPANEKIRPAFGLESIGCRLLDDERAEATFKVSMRAVIDPAIGPDITEELASATLLTKDDLCGRDAYPPVLGQVSNGILEVFPGSDPRRKPKVPDGDADTIRVFAEYKDDGALENIAVSGNGGATQKFPAAGITSVSYTSPTNDDRAVSFRATATEGRPFPLPVSITTRGGEDKVVLQLRDGVLGLANLGGGNDTFTGGVEVDRVFAGEGDDSVTGGANADALFGQGGADNVNGVDGDDEVDGGAGADTVSGGRGTNVVVGGPDADTLVSLAGADKLYGDEKADLGVDATGAVDGGADRILTGGGADFVVGGNGNDEIFGAVGELPADNVGVTVRGNGGNDKIATSNGEDHVWGGPGEDAVTNTWGGGDEVYGGADNDTINTGDGDDRAFGDRGVDACTQATTNLAAPPESGTDPGEDVIVGGAGDDRLSGEAGNDPNISGGDGADSLCGHAGNDTLKGDAGTDTAWGGSGDDTLEGGNENDLLYGGADADTADGGNGDDVVLGQAGDDTDLRGGSDDDHIEGGSGADTAHGDTGQDDVLGGSSPAWVISGLTTATVGDTGDTLLNGGNDHDVIVGDNGVITRTSATNANNGAVIRSVTLREAATAGGGDTIDGERGDDALYGGAGTDTVQGGLHDDHIEGNAGDDALYGTALDVTTTASDQDDMIGGSSAVNPDAVKEDAGETIVQGGSDRDVMVGDNGEIVRPVDASGRWLPDPITGGVLRTVTLADRGASAATLAVVSGGDYLEGNDSLDRMFGQGGADYLKGNAADDQIEGDQGSDRIEGNDGDDDLIGGSALSSAPGAGDPDSGDSIAGGAGTDVLIGDNAAVSRAGTPPAGVDWDSVQTSWLGFASRRSVTLLDKQTADVTRFGDDTLSGGSDADVLFGQDGADRIYGGAHDDYMEGNGATDTLFGDQLAPPTGNPHESPTLQLNGPAGPDGQDDQIGGSSLVRSTQAGAVTGQRDGADEIHGDGGADVQLGDNGRAVRRIVNGQYLTYFAQTQRSTIVRQAALAGSSATALPARFDVGASAGAGVFGNDTLFGDAGDDVQFGQDGNDILRGGAADDDMYGELGDDDMQGEAGEDAMLGDRGVITNRLVTSPGTTFAVNSVPAMSFTPFAAHPYDRRVDTSTDGDGTPVQSPGLTTGGRDLMRGGDGHDSIHGQAGNDFVNGDGGGDYVFGDDGVDVMWGGRGRACADPLDAACNGDRGVNDEFVDVLFGGRGLKTDPVTGGADILDFRPRPGVDPAAWFDATDTEASDPVAAHQHHQGIDWIYGGWDRDVMQANIADNGPNAGDRLLDWTGAYNLYTHCPSAYGGYNDVRVLSPAVQGFLEQLAFALGAGASLTEVRTAGTSGFNELALVYNADVKSNSGSSYPTTPGHFDDFSCAP
jgi:Ca2+-binding RTX toxin-like protein